MGSLLLPGYEHQIVSGAGLSLAPGMPKFVLHTTETGYNSIQFLINHWFRNWGSGLPHFVIEGKRCVQLLPLNVGAYTLENAPGGADTNRSGPAIQCEVVSYASTDWDADTYNTVGKMLADVKRAGHNYDLNNFTKFYGANEGIVLASYGSPIRMGAQEYVNFNGWTDHAHVPENAHWDIGKKDGNKIAKIANAHYNGTNTQEEDIMATIQEMTNAINQALTPVLQKLNAMEARLAELEKRDADGMWRGTDDRPGVNGVFVVSNGVKRHVPGELANELETLGLAGYDNRGVQTKLLSVLPEEPYYRSK